MPHWFAHAGNVPDHDRRYVARQPILNRQQQTLGYEILFRDGGANCFCADGELASRTIIDDILSFGLDALVGDARPFVNCTRSLLLQGIPTLLPRSCVLEILESVAVDEELVQACKMLRRHGYDLALDDYDFNEEKWHPLLPLASFIKVDFRCSDTNQRRQLLTRQRHRHDLRFVAEKVESASEFKTATREGFDLFQGYFFLHPVVYGRRALSAVVSKLRVLKELRHPVLDTQRIVLWLREEPSIAYRLLRLANAVTIGVSAPVSDLLTALMLVGEEQFRKLAITAVTSELCGKQPIEVHRIILKTARFCELMSDQVEGSANELYVFGMLSAVGLVLEIPADTMSRDLVIQPEMRRALAGEENHFHTLLRCAASHDRGDWDAFGKAALALGNAEDTAFRSAMSAQLWADQVVTGVTS